MKTIKIKRSRLNEMIAEEAEKLKLLEDNFDEKAWSKGVITILKERFPGAKITDSTDLFGDGSEGFFIDIGNSCRIAMHVKGDLNSLQWAIESTWVGNNHFTVGMVIDNLKYKKSIEDAIKAAKFIYELYYK